MLSTNGGPKFFYGWVIVAVAALALVVSNGLAVGGIPVFYEPVRDELVRRGAIAAESAQSVVANFGALTFLVAGFSAPLAGWLAQRLRLRSLMLAGCVILGGALAVHARATAVETIYLARVLMGLSLGFVGVLSSTVLVSKWFVRRRGAALGIALTGTSVGGVLIPLVAQPLIAGYGWRAAMLAVSLLVWLVLLPAVIFLVKEAPADLGLRPDGDVGEPESHQESEESGKFKKTDEAVAGGERSAGGDGLPAGRKTLNPPPGLTLSEALRTPLFWTFALCAALIFYPLFVTTQQLILYLRTERIGMSPAAAASMISLLSALSIGGKFFFGFLSDRFSPARVLTACCAAMFGGALFLLDFSAAAAPLFLVPFGLGYGGTFVLLQRLIADYFGARDYAKILGIVTVVETIGAAVGGRVTGYVADADGGDYARAFHGVVVATGLALILAAALNLMTARRRPGV